MSNQTSIAVVIDMETKEAFALPDNAQISADDLVVSTEQELLTSIVTSKQMADIIGVLTGQNPKCQSSRAAAVKRIFKLCGAYDEPIKSEVVEPDEYATPALKGTRQQQLLELLVDGGAKERGITEFMRKLTVSSVKRRGYGVDLQDGVYTIVFPAGVTELPPARGRGVNS